MRPWACQSPPKIATSSSDFYVVWEDTRLATESATANQEDGDENIWMQKFDGFGIMQWPAASSANSPYAVLDVRVDTATYPIHYSGKPVFGGIYNDSSDGTDNLVIGWEDNRNSGDPMDIYAQTYDLSDYTIDDETSWTAYWDHNDCTVDLDVNVGIVESNGIYYAPEYGKATAINWDVTSGEGEGAAGEDSDTWTTGSDPKPPSDNMDNITMRRLIVTFTRNSGSCTIYYDNDNDNSCGTGNDCDSRLFTGTIVPEKSLFLGMIVPFLPPAIRVYRQRQSKRQRKKKR